VLVTAVMEEIEIEGRLPQYNQHGSRVSGQEHLHLLDPRYIYVSRSRSRG
jgi:hypothetical protein